MPDFERKKKMISLRLYEEEYDLLKTHYRTHGARNISDLFRLALHRILNGSAATPDDIAAKLAELDNRVRALESHALARAATATAAAEN